jgi:O-antigen ligase
MSYCGGYFTEIEGWPLRRTTSSGHTPFLVWLLIGYMWLFIHRPFEIWMWLAPYRPERIFMVATIVCWLFSNRKRLMPNRLHTAFAAFVLAILLSWCVSPYQSEGAATVEDYMKYAVFYVIVVTTVHDRQGLQSILAGHFCILTLVMVHALREYYCGNAIFEQGIRRMLGTGVTFRQQDDFAGLIVCSLPFAWTLWRVWRPWWKRAVVLMHYGLGVYCVMLTGSRMGFIGIIVLVLLATIISAKRWRLLALYCVLAPVIWSALPADRQNRYLTLIDPTYGPASASASAGSWRYGGFEKGLGLFNERPLFGWGPMGYRHASGGGMMPHNLYGQLFSELGLAGVVAFALVLLGVLLNVVQGRRLWKVCERGSDVADDESVDADLAWRTVCASSAAFVVLAVMAWGFNFLFWHVWLWFGCFQVVAFQRLRESAALARLRDVDLYESGVVDWDEPMWTYERGSAAT